MMNKHFKTYILSFALMSILFFSACQKPGLNSTGSEYMPDMTHSVAYEANYYNYYYNNTWGSAEEYYEFAKPRLPVAGTVAHSAYGSSENGSVPYYYEDTEEDRTRATSEIIENPYKITDEGLDRAKGLYNIYCGLCHGEKGDGSGYLVRDDGGVYPVQPANFLLDEFVNASNGRMYHSIMFGKNLMGSYKDKLSHEERWQVIHYIRSLQAKELKLVYNQYENTLNDVEVPAGDIVAEEPAEHMDEDHAEEGEHQSDESHEEEHH